MGAALVSWDSIIMEELSKLWLSFVISPLLGMIFAFIISTLVQYLAMLYTLWCG